MKKYRSSCLTVACLIAGSTTSASAQTAMTHWNQQQTAAWQKLVDGYFDQVYLPFNPTAGTSAGLHQYDSRLEDYSRSAIDQHVAKLHKHEQKVASFPTAGLKEWDRGDREFLLGNIRSQLLTLEAIRPWQRIPIPIRAASPTVLSRLSSATTRRLPRDSSL